ncbi:efflux RND transporter periplasmic adaptor subunit, partial [Enterobacter sp. 63]
AQIRPQVGGIILKRLFLQGTEVKSGQPLYQIDPASFLSDVDSAKAALYKAKASAKRESLQVSRLRQLVKTGAVSQQMFDDAVSSRDEALADVASAQAFLSRKELDLSYATIKSPIAGRIDETLVTEGALVSTSDVNPMAYVNDIDSVYIDIRQPSSSFTVIRRQLPMSSQLSVNITRDDGTDLQLHGRILFSGITVDKGTGDILIRILASNPERQLLPGMFVRARITVWQSDHALMVPQQAVIRNQGQTGVWTVDNANKAHFISVETGVLVNQRYQIVSGIKSDDMVVTVGTDHLTEGAEVSMNKDNSGTI